MANRLQLRRGTAADWITYNPLLAEGELVVELDTSKFKIGDGIHNWLDLPYSTGPVGATGPTGPTGPQGEVGPAGPTGVSIASFTHNADIDLLARHAVISTVTGCTYASNQTLSHQGKVVGVTSSSAGIGTLATIYSSGLLSGFTSLTVNAPVFLSTNGILTQTVPTTGFLQKIGIAISQTEVIIGIGPAVKL
jgi:Major tropism determinant N-terminal domain